MPDKQHKPLQWDKINSTYWWQMKLDLNNPRNLVAEIYGYSKAQGHDEARDKKQMLMGKIVMLHTNDYLNRSKEILFYKRVSDTGINKKEDLHLFTLTAKKVTAMSESMLKHQDFITFLDKFYKAISEGKNPKFLLPTRKANFSKDEYLDIDIQFTRIGHDLMKLSNYCSRLIQNGHSFIAANNFFFKYKEKFIRDEN